MSPSWRSPPAPLPPHPSPPPLLGRVAVCVKRSVFLPPGLTAAAAAAANAAIAEAMKVKKIKLEAMSGYHSNANHHGADGENGDLSSSVGEQPTQPSRARTLSPFSLRAAATTTTTTTQRHFRRSGIQPGTVCSRMRLRWVRVVTL